MNAILELAESGAHKYIENVAQKLTAEGLTASGEIARGSAANEIISAAERTGADLIVLATHGRNNIDAFWSGSVTPPIIARVGCPVLLVRVSGEESAR